jgi:phenylalanyl-tRNA synthetase alpha chain
VFVLREKLLAFLEGKGFVQASDAAKALGVSVSSLMSFLETLGKDGLVQVKSEENRTVKLTPEGVACAEKGLPEKRLADAVTAKTELGEALRKSRLSEDEGKIALQWAIRGKTLSVSKQGGKTFLERVGKGELPLTGVLKELALGNPVSKDFLAVLVSRKLAVDSVEKTFFVKETGKSVASSSAKEVSQLTPELIRVGKPVELRPYDVKARTFRSFQGKRHPLQLLMDEMRSVLLQMGFKEMDGPIVESSFWNFDQLFMPQDHPNRDLMDTFFLTQPAKAKLPQKLVPLVKQVHENGGKTGSKGWGGKWTEEEAQKTILRTHTTATSFRYLANIRALSDKVKVPVRYFSINRVFRNEAIDAKHLPEFHQVEGFVVGKVNLRHLMGTFREFYSLLGIEKIRFKPTFNPYTEPSMEIFGYHPKLGKWIEIGNSGMFRPETLQTLGVSVDESEQVIAWGLAVERAAMILFGIEDIRTVMGSETDLQWARDFPIAPKILR